MWPAGPLTLDDIEKKVLPEFHDPRVYLALGRGAVGSGRLRSEAYVPARLETQLSEMVAECTSRPVCAQIDRNGNKILASAIFSWREKEFSATYATKAPAAFATRSPIERAILSLVEPKLLAAERQLFAQNYLPGRLRALRLVPERPDRSRRPLNPLFFINA